jgi:hypothetical protein
MNLPSFLTMLFENGRVQVPPAGPITADELDEARRILLEFEREYRVSLAGAPPAFDVKIGCQSAVVLFRICQCLAYRELNPQELLADLLSNLGAANLAAAHYSSDLALRFLPDVWRLARDASENDPLVSYLLELACAWPLSSVGIQNESNFAIDGFADNPSLMALYVDRIIERCDKSRLGDQRVREAFRAAVGAHAELAGELAAMIGESKQAANRNRERIAS